MPEATNNLENKNTQNILISWTFPEFIKHQRSKWWYVITFTLSALLLIYTIISANWLFALIIIMIDVILVILQHKEPMEVDFLITKKGVQMDQKFLPYKELDKFWLIYEPPSIKNLYLVTKSKLRPRLSIPLGDINPLKVRQILLEYLDEDLSKEDEPTSEALSRILKI